MCELARISQGGSLKQLFLVFWENWVLTSIFYLFIQKTSILTLYYQENNVFFVVHSYKLSKWLALTSINLTNRANTDWQTIYVVCKGMSFNALFWFPHPDQLSLLYCTLLRIKINLNTHCTECALVCRTANVISWLQCNKETSPKLGLLLSTIYYIVESNFKVTELIIERIEKRHNIKKKQVSIRKKVTTSLWQRLYNYSLGLYIKVTFVM